MLKPLLLRSIIRSEDALPPMLKIYLMLLKARKEGESVPGMKTFLTLLKRI
jgi:hypothetical protein